MGKAKQLKLIRKAAKALPTVTTIGKESERMTATEAHLKGIKDKDGKVVPNVAGDVRIIKTVQVPINHNKEMKRLYNSQGMKGVAAYAETVVEFANKKTEQQ